MELLDKLSKVARKVEKKTVIHLTADEKKLLAEIEQQHAGDCSRPEEGREEGGERERERERVCVCVCVLERESVCVCVCRKTSRMTEVSHGSGFDESHRGMLL
jgi:hypothetical protein